MLEIAIFYHILKEIKPAKMCSLPTLILIKIGTGPKKFCMTSFVHECAQLSKLILALISFHGKILNIRQLRFDKCIHGSTLKCKPTVQSRKNLLIIQQDIDKYFLICSVGQAMKIFMRRKEGKI